MSYEIVIQGETSQQIADQIARIGDRIVRAVIVIETDADRPPAADPLVPGDDHWSADLRLWAANRPHASHIADDSRESIYGCLRA